MANLIDELSIIESHDDWLLEYTVNEHGSHDMSKVVNRKNKKKIAQLHYELELANELNLTTLLRPIAIEQNDQYIKLNYQSTRQKYVSLAQYISAPLPTYDFLKIAIKITNCFIDLHQASYIYQNIHPKHFLIDSHTGDIKLYNTEHVFKYSNYAHSLEIEKELPYHRLEYIAPEETGRVTSEVDFQTDLYSLGVLFYKMLSNRTPYLGNSTMLLNKMLTTNPPTFIELGINVPTIVEKIILKLLSKNKENRYQSAIGVKEDLALCWYRITNKLPLHEFELAMQDNINKRNLNVIIPTRQRMIYQLSQQMKKCEGQQIHLLKGKEGVGKSYALLTMYKSCLAELRFVLQLAKGTKHAKTKIPVFLLAFRQQLVRFIEANDQTKDNWKQKILSLHLTLPKLVLTYFPELEPYKEELNITAQQEVVEQEQLFMILSQIIELFHTQALPAVILVDDWHQLDIDSRQFIEFLIKKQSPYIFLFAEQQTNDITHLLQENNQSFTEHPMSFLSKEEVMEWITYSFKSDEEALHQLAEFLFDITQGSSLLIQELFLLVCEQQVLKYDYHSHEWQFDIHASQLKRNIPNFHEFIVRSLEKLSHEQLDVLKHAACIGLQFDIEMLLNIVPLHKEKTLQIFNELLKQRFFIARQEQVAIFRTYMDFNIVEELQIPVVFLSEQLLEDTLKLMTAEELAKIHYAIASSFKRNGMQLDEEKRVLVHHLSFCQGLLTGQELDTFLTLNFELGNKAMQSGMFREALIFSRLAYDALTPAHWKSDYQLTLEVYVMHANALYLNGHKKADEIFEVALKHCEKTYDQLFVYNEKVLFYMMGKAESYQNDLIEILEMVDEALKPMKISIKTNLSNFEVAKEYLLLKAMLIKHPADQLLNLPKTKNETMELILRLLLNISGAALIVDEKLYAWITMRAVRLIIKHGDVEFASVFYGNLGNLLVTGFKDLKEASLFGQLSVKHVKKYDIPLYKSNVYMNYGITISYLKKSYDTSIYYLAQTQKYHLNNSLHHLFNAMAGAYTLNFMLLQGTKLTKIEEEYKDQIVYLESTNNRISLEYANEILHWIHILQNINSKVDWAFPVEVKGRASYWESHLVLRLQMSYLLHDKQQADALLPEIQASLTNGILTANRPQYYYYRALWNFRKLEEDLPKKKVISLIKDSKHCMKELSKYAQQNKQNFEHMLILLKAQYYRFTNQVTKAILYFDRAIQLAKLVDNYRDKAIALLNAALFYESQREVQKAKDYMERAIQTLHNWQAPRIVQVWDENYAYLRKRELVFDQPSNVGLDIEPIVTMYQIIASENKIDKLLKNCLLQIMKHLDAESISLFMVKMKTPTLLASANSVKEEFLFMYDQNEHDWRNHPFMVETVQEVMVTKKIAFHNEALAKGKSAVCIPIFIKGGLKALVYCANNTIASIFTKNKIDLVTIMATQMLIAIENIESKNILEQEVKERTLELVQVNNQLQKVNNRLKQNEEERKYFIQHISHDLRSPITSVLGYIEALSDGLVKTEEQRQQYLARSKTRLRSLKHLIQDLFDISLLEGGRIEYKKEQFSAKRLFLLLDHFIQNGLEEQPVRYLSHFKGEDVKVVVDIERIKQVMDNLTSNICKYANEGTVQFAIHTTKQSIEISLSDEGQGIPEKDLPFIFDMHFSASNNQNKDAHGIGLVICKQIIEHHEGTLRVSSQEHKGTTMTITLPAHE